MLHIERLVIHNFKSFKHANLQFSDGFNCIAGPNGSGKSNICDALLFAFGEQSLKRLRVTNVSQLINDSKSRAKDNEVHPTYIKAVLGGDMPVEILRAIRNNKVVYRLNGKRVTRQDLVSFLNEKGSSINETNTITQGEIGKLLALNSKERRELIDIAAGIKEFDIKKEAALKELDKVEAKISAAQMVLNERAGFMAELEKEKAQAEQYAKLSDLAKRLNYTLLTKRENEVLAAYNNALKSYDEWTRKKKELDSRITEIDISMSDLSQKRETLSKSINESSIGASATNKLLEQLNRDIATKESELAAAGKSVAEIEGRDAQMNGEAESITAKIDENSKAIESAEESIEELEKQVPNEQIEGIENSENISAGYKESVGRLNSYSEMITGLESKKASTRMEIEETEKAKAQLSQEIAGIAAKIKESTELAAGKKAELEATIAEKDKALERIRALQSDIDSMLGEASKKDGEKLQILEQLAASGNVYDKIEKLLLEKLDKGFFGRVSGICSYDDKYAMAVNAAAYSRLNYFVVDTVETAERAISELKRTKAGRASFIPMDDLKAVRRSDEKDLESLISHVRYERRFEKVAEYVFSNIYIVGEIHDAKKHGIGSVRYVTLDGTLLDPSGIVTGGNMRVQVSSAVLESKLKSVSDSVIELNREAKERTSEIGDLKKVLSAHESASVKAETEIRYRNDSINEIKNRKAELEAQLLKYDSNAKALASSLAEIEGNLGKYRELESKERERSSELYKKLDTVLFGTGLRADKKEVARVKELREKLEKLKMDLAGRRKENEMLEQRLKAVIKEIDSDATKLKALKSSKKIAAEELEKLSGELLKLREKIKGYDESTRSTYNQISGYEEQISKLGNERGRLAGELERLNRDIVEAEMKKAQAEVRLGDIRAELSTYGTYEAIALPMEELEGELGRCKAEIEKLGVVNMKAPELYDNRKKDLEEAQGHMKTLDGEKASIMDMINQIESRKLDVFFETLDAVNKNFVKLYSYIFPDNAVLALDRRDDPFNSGLSIKINMGKNQIPSDRYSGGQRSLMMLVLILSIQMRNPMAFYIFDEIDSALDKENSKKLSLLIKELSGRSQFIVVTHNDSMIIAADTKVGISMQGGESKAVGIALASETDRQESISINK